MLDRPTLIKRIEAGEHFSFLCFYGHSVPADGAITKTCFSQWYPTPFTVDGKLYPTAEHWMMAEKARLFGDDKVRKEILAVHGPADAKAKGRQVKGFSDAVWDARRREIVVEGNLHKFSRHPALCEYLLEETAGQVLVEASPMDRVWGIGLAQDDPRATKPAQWRGENLLGFALMEARARLAG